MNNCKVIVPESLAQNRSPWSLTSLALLSVLVSCLMLAACERAPDSADTGSTATGESAVDDGAAADQTVDYLSSTLRQSVQKLLTDVESTPTNPTNVADRVDILWQWANAMARRDKGLKFMPNLTLYITRIKAQLSGYNLLTNPDGSKDLSSIEKAFTRSEQDRLMLSQFDAYIREMDVREKDPQAFGSLTSDNSGPFIAGSFQTITQTWTVGTRKLGVGGYLMVAQHFMADQGVYQIDDPAGANYVSIRSSNSSVKFKPTGVIKVGQHGGFRAPSPNLAFEVAAGELSQGDTVTITYGDKSGGGRGFKMQSVSNDYYQLPVYIAFEEGLLNSLLDLTAFSVIGKEVAAVQGFVPSVVGVNEAFTLSVRAEDQFFNKASGAIPKLNISLNGHKHAQIPAGEEAINAIKNIRLDKPGVYRFGISSEDGRIQGQSNPVWVQENPKTRIFWGETHGHSGFAEGQGSPDSYFRFGRDESKLDFLTLSEHDLWLDDGEWQHMIDLVNKYNQEGEFIAYLGYEWTNGHHVGGHHNVLYRNPEGRERTNVQYYPVLQELYRGLREKNDPADVLIIPHAHQAGYWKLNDAGMETLIEIHSQHGYFEWFGRQYLAEGHRTGFIAASDDHLGHPGYTSVRPSGFVYQGGLAAVRAADKTSDSIFDAMKEKQTYATTVDRIILDLQVNGVDMGGVARGGKTNKIKGQVMGTAPIDSISIVKNDREIWSKDYRKVDKLNSELVGIELAFNSQSHSKAYKIDNPRGARLWYGYAIVEGAEVVEVDQGHHNALLPPTGHDENNQQRIHFALRTRGETRRLNLLLKGVSKDTSISIHLDENHESPTAPARTRKPQLLPAEAFSFAFSDLNQGQLVKHFQVDEYDDDVTLKLVNVDASLDQRFEFEDTAEAKAGDYYFVRVEQANSGIAWSSPVWIGE